MSIRRLLNTFLKNSRYRVVKINPALNRHFDYRAKIGIEHFLSRSVLQSGSDFNFVQIGANDGVRCDDSYAFITRHKLRGLVVEPLRDMFAALESNYRDHPQIIKVNAAIHASARNMTLYRVRPDAAVPDWCHGIASFDKSHLLKGTKKIPDLERYIVEETVPCLSMTELLKKHAIDTIGFLQIDTEGYDFEIIKMLDFSRYKPAIIRYECATLSSQDNLACIELLIAQGYRIFDDGNDVIAVQEN